MAQPEKAKSKLADTSGNAQIADRGASITVPTDEASNVIAITAVIERLEAHGLIADN